jgi:hypothetical protein
MEASRFVSHRSPTTEKFDVYRADLLNPSSIEPTAEIKHPAAPSEPDLKDEGKFEMTEEEERELAELLDSD